MSEEEFQNAFRNAFYEADAKSRKATTHAAAIVDPALGNNWFRYKIIKYCVWNIVYSNKLILKSLYVV